MTGITVTVMGDDERRRQDHKRQRFGIDAVEDIDLVHGKTRGRKKKTVPDDGGVDQRNNTQ